MAEFVVVVPKHDELMAVEWAFGTTFGRPDDRTRSGVELYRRRFEFGQVTFALLNRQTNTYSSILTADIVTKEAPQLIFLVGTALGRPGQAPIGSVLVSDGVIDVSEKRYDGGQEVFVVRGPTRSDELTLDARDFLSRTFNPARALSQIRSMSRRPALVSAPRGMAEFITTHRPTVLCEAVVSGNDYRMGGSNSRIEDIWLHAPTARAYDMEAAGFALAASLSTVPWLVIRGISDHGTPETKSELNRKVAAGIAGRFLYEFLSKGGVNRAAELPPVSESAITLPLLRDEAFRLDGTWEGAMAYLDDSGEPVVFAETAEFVQEGVNVQGLVSSVRLAGNPRHETLEYAISCSIARHGYAGGIWSETVAARRYFGVLLGSFAEESSVLSGAWLGTHRYGVRQGFFKWVNTRREGEATRTATDLESIVPDLLASFTTDKLRVYNDACKVSP